MNNPDIFDDEKELRLDWYRSYYPMVRKLVRERTGSGSETADISTMKKRMTNRRIDLVKL